MSRFVDGMAWLRDELQTGVCPIHHTGHLDGSRSRGNSSLYGALDYEIKVDRDRASRLIKLSCTKMKDAEEFADKHFESVPVGTPVTDEEGAIQTSIVLVETAAKEAPEDKGLGATQRQMLAVLEALYEEFRSRLKLSGNDPDSARVYMKEWKEKCSDVPGITDRMAFFRRRKSLEERGLIRVEGDFVFLGSKP
jgi:hypothetical protein